MVLECYIREGLLQACAQETSHSLFKSMGKQTVETKKRNNKGITCLPLWIDVRMVCLLFHCFFKVFGKTLKEIPSKCGKLSVPVVRYGPSYMD